MRWILGESQDGCAAKSMRGPLRLTCEKKQEKANNAADVCSDAKGLKECLAMTEGECDRCENEQRKADCEDLANRPLVHWAEDDDDGKVYHC